jgi:hypothetical protein
MKNARKNRQPREIVASRDEAFEKMLAAGRKILDRHTDAEIEAWANKTVDAYITAGIIAVAAH